ncbi:T9SS type A sorting domain-containing protein [candidate division WOR-3 bacterium]|nr:T9SS type A sorting domain-containing protein [candidate division WOR-3 bacterium]
MANLLWISIFLSAIEPAVSWQQVIDNGTDEKLKGMDFKNRTIYLAGASLGSDSSIIVVVIDDSGSEKWSKLFGRSNRYEVGEDVAVLPSGNIVVTGWYNIGARPGWFSVWVDSLGEQKYKDSMPKDPNGFSYKATSVVAASNDTTYVGGWYFKPDWIGFRVEKYNPVGERMWRHFVDGEGYNARIKLALDSEESVYALCEYHCTWTGWLSDGNTLGLQKNYIKSAAEGAAIRINPADHVFIAGDVTASDRDFMLLKYDTDGTKLWPAHKAYDLGGEEECRDMALDAISDCYLAGFQISGEEEDAAIVKTDSAGNLLWSWVDTVPGKREIEAIEVDPEGYVYLVGSHHNGDDWDMLVEKIRQPISIHGQIWLTGGYSALPDDGKFIVTGDTSMEIPMEFDDSGYYQIELYNGGNYDVVPYHPLFNFVPKEPDEGIGEYKPLVHRMVNQDWVGYYKGVVEEAPETYVFGLEVNSGEIRFSLPEAMHVNFALYDASGRKVKVLARGLYPRGVHPVKLPEMNPGVYFVKMNAGESAETRKVIITK